MKTAQCIAIDHERRCERPAGKRSGDIFVCARHSTMWLMLLLDDGCAPHTRRMLAFAKWETLAEGQRLIQQMRRRKWAA